MSPQKFDLTFPEFWLPPETGNLAYVNERWEVIGNPGHESLSMNTSHPFWTTYADATVVEVETHGFNNEYGSQICVLGYLMVATPSGTKHLYSWDDGEDNLYPTPYSRCPSGSRDYDILSLSDNPPTLGSILAYIMAFRDGYSANSYYDKIYFTLAGLEPPAFWRSKILTLTGEPEGGA